MAAAMQCSKCTAERKGFRRELDSWRHTLIHCVGFESILTGIYGPMLLKDLNLFVDCEPDEVDDWSSQASLSQCLFCNLPLDKLNDQVPAAASPVSSPSDYSPCQASTISESSQSAHRFLQAVFQKKDVTLDCDPKIPLLAQELMKKMIRQFAEEYMSKCQLSTPTNGVTRPSSPSSQTSDGPLDLTVNRKSEEKESEPETGGVLDLSKRNPAISATSSSNHDALGSWLPSVAEEGRVAGQRGTTSHRRSALDAVLRFLCPAHQSLIYKIFKLAHQERLLPPHNHRPCTVPNRERSPSPPRLSPIPQHISKKVDEKPPSLYHHAQEKEADPMVKNSQRSPRCRTAGLDGATEPQCRTVGHERAEQNAEETLLQDVVRRFNRKLEAITSGDKDPAIVSAAVSEEQSQRPSTSEPFPVDVPQIETSTALHTGGASDNLSEQLNRHQDRGPRSPNTRSRRRQEAHVAVATPADAARTRRNTSAVKRKFAMLDPSCDRRKGTKAKKGRLKEENTSVPTSSTSSEPDLLKEASERKTEARAELVKNHGVNEGTPSTVSAQSDRGKAKEETKAAMVTDELPTVKEEREGETGVDKRDLPISAIRYAPELQSTRGKQAPKADYVQTPAASMTPTCVTQIPRLCTEGCGWGHEEATSVQHLDSGSFPVSEGQKCKSHQSTGVRKSMRNINPPQWISDYVISPPVFHGSSVETDGTRAKVDSKSPLDPQEHKGNLTFEPTPKEAGTQVKGKCQGLQKTVAIEKKSSPGNSPEKETDGNDCPAYRTRQSSTRTPQALKSLQITLDSCSSTSPKSQYVSPIRIMFVSPVKDNEGVKYSLKSASSGFSLETEEPFDPCVESSWSGTPQKHKSESKEWPVSPTKKSPSPAKASSISSPAKSPKCQASPRSAASSPKPRSRTSGDSTPSKRLSETENQRSPRESVSLCETTPPKRRPGRPRKLGPQLEQKAKRPIGRPRKQKQADAVTEFKSPNGKSSTTDADDDVTKNLKITVVYGRSRRNKRVVSESFDQLQTHFKNACNAVCLKSDLGLSLHCSRRSSGVRKLPPEEFSPAIEPPPQSSSSIKSQGQNDSAPSRKPGRPAKIKISGISVTVTAASPRRRQIQINRETRVSPKTLPPKKAPLPESAEHPCTGSSQRPTETSQTEVMETRNRNKCEPPNQTVALRHPQRERKPSIHLLHAVATSPSRWYKCSHALLRRSRQLLMNKASHEKRQEEQQASAESQAVKRQPCRKERQRITQELNKVAKISLDSIFSPGKTVRWWAASAKEKTMNQELARRIRAISDTWVAADEQNKVVQTSALDTVGDSPVTRKSKMSSAVRALFDCSSNEPRSCSMQQISYWFMQTTETQSLAIVKKASSRNPYELMHFPRSTSKESVRHSPQAERLHKHIKKFPRAVPISPLQHRQAQLRLRKKKRARRIRGRLLVCSLAAGIHTRGLMWWRSSLSAQFRATLFRVRRRFLTLRERERWQRWKGKKQRRRKTPRSNGPVATALQPDQKASRGSAKRPLPDSLRNSSVDQTLKRGDVPKEQKLSSKAWSPEKLKECRVFLRKINSPDNESAEEEGDSCTVTLDNGSPSTDLFEGKEKGLGGAAKAVRNGRKRSSNKRTCSTNLSDPAPKSMPKGKQRAKHKQAEVAPPEEPPPAKVLRQSRMRGLTGLRWCDFVFET